MLLGWTILHLPVHVHSPSCPVSQSRERMTFSEHIYRLPGQLVSHESQRARGGCSQSGCHAAGQMCSRSCSRSKTCSRSKVQPHSFSRSSWHYLSIHPLLPSDILGSSVTTPGPSGLGLSSPSANPGVLYHPSFVSPDRVYALVNSALNNLSLITPSVSGGTWTNAVMLLK